MHKLGRLEEGVRQLREDFKEEKETAHESRAVIHRRLDEHVEVISGIKTDVAIAAKVDAQVRDELKALKVTVDGNRDAIQPSIDEWARMKTIGIGIVGLLALGGLSVGAALVWMGDAAVTAVRHWLKID